MEAPGGGSGGGIMYFKNGTNTNMVIKANGNISIGVSTNPGAKLQINDGDGNPLDNEFQTHAFEIWGTDQMMDIGVNSTDHVAYIQSVDIGTSASNLALNPRGGNVGIGTIIPGYNLDVVGTGRFTSTLTMNNANITAINSLIIDDDGANEGIDWQNGRNISIYTIGQGGYNAFVFNTSSTYPFVFNTGNVGIGTTSPQAKVSSLADGTSTTPNFLAATTGAGQGEKSAYTLSSTFMGTGDNFPKRTADILAGFSGAWGSEYLAFHVGKNGAANDGFALTDEKMRILTNGNVGIGTTGPGAKLHVYGGSNSSDRPLKLVSSAQYEVAEFVGPSYPSILLTNNGGNTSYISNYNNLGLAFSADEPTWNTADMVILNNGNVGIGKPDPDFELDVEGTVRACTLKVNITGGGCDYVFYKGYNKDELDYVKDFTEKYHHLPGVDPAKEMKKEGLNVSNMFTTLLKKTEEIFLHLFDFDKTIKGLNNADDKLFKNDKAMEKKIDKLEKENKELNGKVDMLVKRIKALEKK